MVRIGIVVVLGGCGFQPAAVTAGGGDDAPMRDVPLDMPAIDATSLQDGLVAWYKMDSITGTVAIDATGHGHEATCGQCPTVVSGHIGNGYSFNGATRFDVANDGAFDLPAGFTVATWVNFTVLSGAYNCPVGKIEDTTNLNSWELCWVSTPAWGYYSVHDKVSGFDVVYGTPAPAVHVWYHAALTWDGTTKQLWIDGAMIGVGTAPGIAFAITGAMTFGADTDYGSQSSPLNGIMDDLRIYNRVLTPAEIGALAMQ